MHAGGYHCRSIRGWNKPQGIASQPQESKRCTGGGQQAHYSILEQEIRTLSEHRAIIYVALGEYLAKMQRELEDENTGHKERVEFYTDQIAQIKKTIDILDFDIEKL